MALTQKSEDTLERLVFELGVMMAEAESGRTSDIAELKSRVAAACRKWRDEVESLITAADPTLHATVNLLSLRQENAALKQELDATKGENTSLAAENAQLKERPATAQPKKAPPEKPKETTEEKPQEKSEFSDAMKDVRRY